MYAPRRFAAPDQSALTDLISAYPFGTLTTVADGRPHASHLPFVVAGSTLFCHLARANPQVGHLREGTEILCTFQGPHAYISPSWYESPGVPTWNYVAVHAYGAPTLIEDPTELADIVDQLTAIFESHQTTPWTPQYDVSKLAAIVGVRIELSDIQGSFKLSQNRSAEDRRNVVAQLATADSDLSRAVAALMQAGLD